MGHLPTYRYLELFDKAAYHFLAELGADFSRSDFGFADVRHEIDYLAEVRAGALLLVRSWLLAVGRSSLRCRSTLTNVREGTLHARIETVTVYFDLVRRASAALPTDFTRRAEGYLAPDDGEKAK